MVSLEYEAGTSSRCPSFDPCMVLLLSTAWILDPLVLGHCGHTLLYLSSAGFSPPQTNSTGSISMSLNIPPSGPLLTFRPSSGLCLTFWSWFGSPYHCPCSTYNELNFKGWTEGFETKGTSRCQCFMGQSQGS